MSGINHQGDLSGLIWLASTIPYPQSGRKGAVKLSLRELVVSNTIT